MGIIDVFSKRNKKLPDVFTYDELPNKLRAQIVHIFEEALGPHFDNNRGWSWVAKTIAHEHGILDIPQTPTRIRYERDYFTDCLNYVLQAEWELALDMVELVMRIIDRLRNDRYHHTMVRISTDDGGRSDQDADREGARAELQRRTSSRRGEIPHWARDGQKQELRAWRRIGAAQPAGTRSHLRAAPGSNKHRVPDRMPPG